jgi:hypothetical protein
MHLVLLSYVFRRCYEVKRMTYVEAMSFSTYFILWPTVSDTIMSYFL